MADPRLRQFTIKTGVLKRVAKEKLMYGKEAEQQRDRIQKLKNEGKDEYVLKKEEECLQECLMMVPDSQRRLTKAYNDLNDLIKNEAELKESKEYEAAVAVLTDVLAQLDELE